MREVTDDPVEQDDDEDDYWECDGTSGFLGEDEDYYGWYGQKEDGIVFESFYEAAVAKAVQRAGGAAARALETCEGAERAAVANMVSSGHTDPVAIAICYNETEFALPCGICRQVLSEFADPNEDLVVLMAKLDGAYK